MRVEVLKTVDAADIPYDGRRGAGAARAGRFAISSIATIWITAALAYCALYAGLVSFVSGNAALRMWIGDVGLLVSPVIPVIIVIARRRAWNQRALVYWSTVAFGCCLWLAGHVAWSTVELLRQQPLPWLEWPVALKLTGGVMPMLGLVAWPHARIRGGSIAIVILDVAGLTLVSGFLFWSLVVAPGYAPYASAVGVRSLTVLGTAMHLMIVMGFAGAAYLAGPGPWRSTYQRLALGSGLGTLLLTANAGAMTSGTYVTGSFGDVGWILPFWGFAWAAWEAPASPEHEVSPVANWIDAPAMSPLLFVPALVPIVGYGPRVMAPLGPSLDRFCDVVTAATLTVALGLTLVRVALEQRARHRADYRVWLLATACEQSDDLIVVMRGNFIEYANRAFQRAFGYSLQDLHALPPAHLVAPAAREPLTSLADAMRRHEVGRARLTLQRRDASTFEAACSITPMVSASGRSTYFVGVIHDLTDELPLREPDVLPHALRALRHGEDHFRTLAESLSAAILIAHGSRLAYVNSAVERLTGYSRSELMAMNAWDIVHPRFRPFIQDRRAQRRGRARAPCREMKIATKDGRELWVDVSLASIQFEGQPAIVASAFDVTERKVAEEQLKQSRMQLRSAFGRLEHVRETERRRIARELHDELGQAFTGLKMDLSWLTRYLSALDAQSLPAIEKTQEMTRLIDATIPTVRRLAAELRPAILDELGLLPALEWQLESFASKLGVDCRFDANVEEIHVDATRAATLFRVFQEALTNIARHADATEVEVFVREEGEFVTLVIEDNGRGIRDAEILHSSSLGLIGMRERAIYAGGTVTFGVRRDGGTTVTVTAPLELAHPAPSEAPDGDSPAPGPPTTRSSRRRSKKPSRRRA